VTTMLVDIAENVFKVRGKRSRSLRDKMNLCGAEAYPFSIFTKPELRSKHTWGKCAITLPGPDYPMCTACTCTRGSTTLEAPPPGSRENCHAKVFVIDVWLKPIEITTTKTASVFTVKTLWRPHQNGAHSA